MAIKFDHTGAGDVTLDSTQAVELRVDGVALLTEATGSGLFPADTTGVADHDMLFFDTDTWVDTAGLLTWDGARLTVDQGSTVGGGVLFKMNNAGLRTFTEVQDSSDEGRWRWQMDGTDNLRFERGAGVTPTWTDYLRFNADDEFECYVDFKMIDGTTKWITHILDVATDNYQIASNLITEFDLTSFDEFRLRGNVDLGLYSSDQNHSVVHSQGLVDHTSTFTSVTDWELIGLTGNLWLQDGAGLKISDSTDADSVSMYHDGTDFIIEAANPGTDWIEFRGFGVGGGSGVSFPDGAAFRIYDDGGTDYFGCNHDGTDFNTVLVNTADWNIGSGMSGSFKVAKLANAETTVVIGEDTTLRGNLQTSQFLMYAENASAINALKFLNNGTQYRISGVPVDHNALWFENFNGVEIHNTTTSPYLRIYNSSDTDYLEIDCTSGTQARIFANSLDDLLIGTGFSSTGAMELVNLRLQTRGSSTTNPSINIPTGSAPTAPVFGDIWADAAGIYARITGVTYNLTDTGGGGTLDDLTDVTDAGSANDLLYKSGASAWSDTAGLLTWDASTLIANRKSNATTLIQVGETTTLRGDSQIGEMRLYGEDTSAISFATIQYNGTELRLSCSGTQDIYMLEDVYLRTGHTLFIMNGANTQSLNFDVATDSTIDSTSGDIIMTPASQLIVQGGATDATKLMIDAHDTVGSAAIEFRDSAAAEKGTLGFDNGADDNFFLKNKETGGEVRIQATATGGTTQPALYIDPDIDLAIYHGPGKGGATTVSNEVMQTRSVETDGELSGVKVADANDVFRWVGFNTALPILTNATVGTTSDSWRDNAGHTMYSNNATAYTWTTPGSADSVVPNGYFVGIANTGTGDITIAEGSGVTLTWMDGAGGTGSRTLAQYGYGTLVKVSSTVWWIFGSGIT